MTDLPAIISRKDAIALGMKNYFTGKPCKRGHFSKRNVVGGGCQACRMVRHHNAKVLTRVPVTMGDDGKWVGGPCKYHGTTARNNDKKCPDCQREYTAATSDARKAYMEKWRAENPEKYKQKTKRDNDRNPHRWRERYKIQKRATPNCQTIIQRDEIREFYKNTPEGMVVDHLIPMQGVMAMGLNVIANLQYMPRKDNLLKSNKWPTCQRSMQPAWFDDLNSCKGGA